MTETIQSLIARYKKSPSYLSLVPNSIYKYNMVMGALTASIGHELVTDISRWHGIRIRDDLCQTPAKANVHVRILSALMSYAVDVGAVDFNPITRIKPLVIGEHKPWSTPFINAFKIVSAGNVRRVFYLCLFTGQRISDVLNMKWDDLSPDGSSIAVLQKKTGASLVIPIASELAAEMRDWDRDGPSVVPAMYHRVYWDMKAALARHGCPNLTIHGLRKNAAIALAEAGCTEREIMSITGHKTPAMVSKYVEAANQHVMASAAINKINMATVAVE